MSTEEDKSKKRQKLSEDAPENEDKSEEEHSEQVDATENEETTKEEEVVETKPLDPRMAEIEELAKEFGEDDDEIQVVIGPNASTNRIANPTVAENGDSAANRAKLDNRPAMRFSGASRTAGLWQPLTPEMEEARRVTGVTTENYAHLINPNGKYGKRRSALEDDLNEIEYQKWRDDGAVESDFFNYGLNEQTWKEYAARQVALRLYRMEKAQQQQNNPAHELDAHQQ